MNTLTKVILYILFAICALSLCPCKGHTEDLKLRVVQARGVGGLPRVQVQRMLARLVYEVREETGVRLRVSRFTSLRGYPDFSIQGANNVWADWSLYFRSKSKADVNLAVLPPAKDAGRIWILGWAHVCKRGGTAMASVMPINTDGEGRLQESYTAIKHEVYHVLGARHINDKRCNLMYEAALICGASIPTLPETIREVSKCAGRW